MAIRLYQAKVMEDFLQLGKLLVVYHSVAGHDLKEKMWITRQGRSSYQQKLTKTIVIMGAMQFCKSFLDYLSLA
jgi:hypothetical protein